ncbi:MAG: hypothetical protein HY913_17245 [Desulfomonile tiedjei]|nr:hypothetical protein [Desulfomonile tiedjei]
MNGGNERIEPKIDDRYWFTYSEKLIGKAQESRDQAAEKIQKLVIWLWGIYTAGAAVGFALSGKALSLWPTILIAAASAFLIAVYWGTIWVQVPVVAKFDPRAPADIREAYNACVVAKAWRLKVTLFLSVLAAFMVSLALIVASVSEGQKPAVHEFAATIHPDGDKRTLSITGAVGKTKKVKVLVQPVVSGKESGKSSEFVLTPTAGGLLQTSLPLDPGITEADVTLEWQDPSKMKVQLSKRALQVN